jgi:hypothetical protein
MGSLSTVSKKTDALLMNIYFPVTPDHLSDRLKEIIFQSAEYVCDPCVSGPKHYKIHSPSKGIFFDCWLVFHGFWFGDSCQCRFSYLYHKLGRT